MVNKWPDEKVLGLDFHHNMLSVDRSANVVTNI